MGEQLTRGQVLDVLADARNYINDWPLRRLAETATLTPYPMQQAAIGLHLLAQLVDQVQLAVGQLAAIADDLNTIRLKQQGGR